MTIAKELSPEDRQFFTIVARAAFCNPFGDERRQLDQQIVGKSPGQSDSDLVPMVVDRVAERLEKLQRGSGADIRHYRGSDRQLVRDLVMFHIYHLFCLPFDDFILRQEKEGESPLPLPFGQDILSLLVGHGFSASEAERLIAFFYQVRRAFHFIHRGLIGQSMAMEELRMRLWNQVFTRDAHWYERYLWNRMEDFSTLLLGETGTGKGTAAAAIGRSGFIPYDPQRKTFTESFTRN
ncbi:MAG TPA: sigma-54-dependent Fis family transcriptional regulator, partial [Geobacterales bacterium]|nr:sigma-54-dependent Fis family transcriptional regulator [Geobacterales bacterium]